LNYRVGTAKALQGVEFLHRTTSDDAAKSILQKGFDFSRLGQTAREYGVPKSYTKYDPMAMFASIKTSLAIEPGTPFVSFEIKPHAKVIWHELDSSEIKKVLFQDLDVSDHDELTEKLRLLGVSAICHVKNEDEIIVLNMDDVKWSNFGRHHEFEKSASELIGRIKPASKQHNEELGVVSPKRKR
jgi:hypothetical protein